MNSIKKRTHYDSMFLALIPIVICATIMYSARVLLLCGAAVLTARIVDVAIASARHIPVDVEDKSSTVAAITFCMMMPVSIPVYVVVMTVAIVTLVGKQAFGGRGVYPFNLAALSMCIAAVNWPEKVFTAVKPFATVGFWTGVCRSTATQSSTIKAGGLPYVDLLDLLTGNYAGAMGSSFVLLTIVIAVCLIATRKITWHVPVTFLVVCTAIARAFPRIYGISRINSVKLEILSSSLLFCAVFMLCEPATTPKNPKAKIIFGILAGVITMLYRYFGSYEIGACFAILLVNATESFWDRIIEGDILREFATRETSVRNMKKHTRKKTKPSTEKTKAKDISESAESKALKKAVEKKQPAREKPVEKPVEKEEKIRITEEILAKFGGDEVKTTQKTPTAAEQTPVRKQKVSDIIAEAEDEIDNVQYSTRSIDIDEIMRAIERQQRGGKK